MTAGAHNTEIRVRLKEVAYDHVYFGTVFTWFEVGRSEFCRAAGVPYAALANRGLASFVTSAFADYSRPVPASGVVRLETRLAAMTRSRFTFCYSLFAPGGDEAAVTGQSVHLMADSAGRPRRIPPDVAAAMAPTAQPTQNVEIPGPDGVLWTHRLRARYEETDAFQVVYYGNYFAWMEAAWSARLAEGPWDIARNLRAGRALAVLHAACRYVAPTRYDDEVIVEVGVVPIRRTSLQLDYRFSIVLPDGRAGQTLAFGRTVHAVTEDQRVTRVPADLLQALGVTPPR
jgi:acyl-CoA thioester hydrolase